MSIRTKTKKVREAQSSGVRILLGCLKQQVTTVGLKNHV